MTSMPKIVARLYEGALDPAQWDAALRQVQERLQAFVFHHVRIERGDRQVTTIAAAMALQQAPQQQVQAYEQHYAALDPRLPAVWRLGAGRLWLDHEHFTARQFARDPVYAEFLAGAGLRHSLVATLRADARSRDFVGFMRHHDQPPCGPGDRAWMGRLMPQLAHASMLRHQHAQLARQAALGLAALDALEQSLLLADASGRVAYLNARAELWLRQSPETVQLRAGRLCVPDGATQERLAHALALACAAAPRASSLRWGSAAVHVLPVHAGHALAHAALQQPHALVLRGHGTALPDAAQLARALGVTEAQASLALALAQGRTLAQFAQLHGCTLHTARTHAKNLLHRTGAHRQAEVAGLVRALSW